MIASLVLAAALNIGPSPFNPFDTSSIVSGDEVVTVASADEFCTGNPDCHDKWIDPSPALALVDPSPYCLEHPENCTRGDEMLEDGNWP